MAHSPAVTKAIIPVAGLGTRFLPATKATPKEMLPVVDTPTIHYVVAEAATAGISDVLLVTGRGKHSIEDYFDSNTELEAALEAKGDTAGLEVVRRSSDLAVIHFVRQGAPRGLGHAVLCGADHVGGEPFAVLLGDDFIHPDDLLLQRMAEVRRQRGGSVIALMEVAPEEVPLYGVAAFKPTEEADIVSVTDLVEKPAIKDAPSNWIVIGRYICDPSIFGVLRETPPGRGGEIQLTDALRTLAATDGAVHGVLFGGRRYDTGNKLDYLRTQVQFACERPDIAPEFIPWLRAYLDGLPQEGAGQPRG